MLAEMWTALAGLVWPVSCAGCGADGALCQFCARSLAGPVLSFWLPVPELPVDPMPVDALPVDAPPVPAPPGPGCQVQVWALSAYQGIPARLIVAWKERGRRDLGRPLGRALAQAISSAVADAGLADAGLGGAGLVDAAGVVLIPMPARRSAVRRRGADLPLDLARAAARAYAARAPAGPAGVRVVPGLQHTRRVRDQVGLAAGERRRNLSGAMAVRRRHQAALAGKRCLIVDDIVTTGASVTEATRALTRSGARVVGVCCLSVTFKQQGVLAAPRQTSLSSWKASSG